MAQNCCKITSFGEYISSSSSFFITLLCLGVVFALTSFCYRFVFASFCFTLALLLCCLCFPNGGDPRSYIYNPFISYVYIRLTPTPTPKTCISGKNRLPNPDLGGGTPHLEGSNFGSIFEVLFVQFWVHFGGNFRVHFPLLFGYIFGSNFGSSLAPFYFQFWTQKTSKMRKHGTQKLSNRPPPTNTSIFQNV